MGNDPDTSCGLLLQPYHLSTHHLGMYVYEYAKGIRIFKLYIPYQMMEWLVVGWFFARTPFETLLGLFFLLEKFNWEFLVYHFVTHTVMPNAKSIY
jgi:hypothetical protein